MSELRDMFAAHAPSPPDWWFGSEECPTPPPGWSDGDGSSAWERCQKKWMVGKIAEWSWFYADAMIEARNK